jgi:hypothetical protein
MDIFIMVVVLLVVEDDPISISILIGMMVGMSLIGDSARQVMCINEVVVKLVRPPADDVSNAQRLD